MHLEDRALAGAGPVAAATYAANSEAEAARNGIGLVKLMGRDSGFIAAFSSWSTGA